MSKPGNASRGAAGFAEWLPLLGSICQALAALGEAEETEPGERDGGTKRALGAGDDRD